jgi:hypothetical protein
MSEAHVGFDSILGQTLVQRAKGVNPVLGPK